MNDPADFLLPNGSLNASLVIVHAETLLKAGDVSLALGLFRRVLDSGKLSHLALFGMARCAEVQGQLKIAQSCFEASIHSRPRVETYLKLAQVLQQLKQPVDAVQFLQEALNLPQLSRVQHLELKKKLIESLRQSIDHPEVCGDIRIKLESELSKLSPLE